MDGICREILDNIPTSIFIADGELRMQYCNNSFKTAFNPAAVTGCTVGSGINCANLLKDETCGQGKYCGSCMLSRLLKDALSGKKVYRRIINKKVKSTEGGTKNYFLKLSVVPLKNGFFCCIMDDITEIADAAGLVSKNMNRDLERAKSIQSNMLPAPSALGGLADFTYYYRQNYLVGGDLFDLYRFDEKRFGGYIADVSGSGVSAGMLTVYLHENFPTDVFSPAEALKGFTEKFNGLKFPEEYYITMFCFSADTEKKKLYVSNAGHSIPLLIKRKDNTETVYIRGKTISDWYGNISFSDTAIDYESGDMLILMTDGLPDLLNGEGREYTFERVKSLAAKTNGLMNGLLKRIMSDIVDFTDGKVMKKSDDLTLLIITLK